MFGKMKQQVFGKKQGFFSNPYESAKWALIKLFLKVASVIIAIKLIWGAMKNFAFGPRNTKVDSKTTADIKKLELEIAKLQLEKEKLSDTKSK